MLTLFKHALSSETYKQRRSKRVSCVTYRSRRLDAEALCKGMQARDSKGLYVQSYLCCQMIDSYDYKKTFNMGIKTKFDYKASAKGGEEGLRKRNRDDRPRN
jgi:hypothetical protein